MIDTPQYMQALIYTGQKTLQWQNTPVGKVEECYHPSSSETIVIKTHAVGICGSDMHAWMGHDERRPSPLILGHEASGTALNGTYKGQYVTINPLVTCGECFYCCQEMDNLCIKRQIISMPPLEGAFAEYFMIPQENLIPIPSNYNKTHAALVEPLACGWHAVKKGVQALQVNCEKQKALIIGAGAIGYGAALALSLYNIGEIHIAETNTLRRNYLQKISPFHFFDPTQNTHIIDDTYAIVIDAHGGHTSREFASKAVSSGGVIIHIGLSEAYGGLNCRKMTLNEIQFIGCYTYTKKDFLETAHALFSGQLGKINWCDYRPISQGSSAFIDISNQKIAAAKMILTLS